MSTSRFSHEKGGSRSTYLGFLLRREGTGPQVGFLLRREGTGPKVGFLFRRDGDIAQVMFLFGSFYLILMRIRLSSGSLIRT